MSESIPDDLIRQVDAAELLGVSVGTIHRWVKAGRLRAYVPASHVSRHGPEKYVSRSAALALRKMIPADDGGE